jgi:hypothetical protein
MKSLINNFAIAAKLIGFGIVAGVVAAFVLDSLMRIALFGLVLGFGYSWGRKALAQARNTMTGIAVRFSRVRTHA